VAESAVFLVSNATGLKGVGVCVRCYEAIGMWHSELQFLLGHVLARYFGYALQIYNKVSGYTICKLQSINVCLAFNARKFFFWLLEFHNLTSSRICQQLDNSTGYSSSQCKVMRYNNVTAACMIMNLFTHVMFVAPLHYRRKAMYHN
jgi:hypothetical protein